MKRFLVSVDDAEYSPFFRYAKVTFAAIREFIERAPGGSFGSVENNEFGRRSDGAFGISGTTILIRRVYRRTDKRQEERREKKYRSTHLHETRLRKMPEAGLEPARQKLDKGF